MLHSLVDLYHAIESYWIYLGGLVAVIAVQLTKPDTAIQHTVVTNQGETEAFIEIVGNHIFLMNYPLVEVLQIVTLIVALTGGLIKLILDLSPRLTKLVKRIFAKSGK